MSPEELATRIKARWSWLDNSDKEDVHKAEIENSRHSSDHKSAIYIADYDSIEQLSLDLAIMPGAGISNIEVVPVSDRVLGSCWRS